MRAVKWRLLAVVACLGVVGLSGCEEAQFKADRVVELSADLAAGGMFEAQTHNGYITVNGGQVSSCDVTAKIQGRATTQERADELAALTTVTLEPRAGGLAAVINKPPTSNRESVSVSLDVGLPRSTALKLLTHNGAVTVVNIEGPVACETHNGAIVLTDVAGKVDAVTHNGKIGASNVGPHVKLETYNGQIVCDAISGDAWMKTHNGNVNAVFDAESPSVCEISAVTHNGNVDVVVPAGLSAMAKLSTHNGSIKTSLPITVEGDVSKKRIFGKIGDGQGKLHLETYNGSVKLR